MKDSKDQSTEMNINQKQKHKKHMPLILPMQMFVLVFDNTNNGNKKVGRDSYRKYFLPRVNITNYNVLIDGRNFYDQPINDQIKKYDEVRKITTGQGMITQQDVC